MDDLAAEIASFAETMPGVTFESCEEVDYEAAAEEAIARSENSELEPVEYGVMELLDRQNLLGVFDKAPDDLQPRLEYNFQDWLQMAPDHLDDADWTVTEVSDEESKQSFRFRIQVNGQTYTKVSKGNAYARAMTDVLAAALEDQSDGRWTYTRFGMKWYQVVICTDPRDAEQLVEMLKI